MKTAVSLLLGLALAAVGIRHGLGRRAAHFGSDELVAGVPFLVAVIGLFGIGEILVDGGAGAARSRACSLASEWGDVWTHVAADAALRLGALVRVDAHRLLDGHHAGRSDGGVVHELWRGPPLLAPQARTSARARSKASCRRRPPTIRPARRALLPMLALGVPGSATAAVMMGGLMIWGLQPGPLLFVEQREFVWGLIASMYVGNIVAVDPRARDGADLRVGAAHSVLHHRAADLHRLRRRRLFGLELLSTSC